MLGYLQERTYDYLAVFMKSLTDPKQARGSALNESGTWNVFTRPIISGNRKIKIKIKFAYKRVLYHELH